ncbi:MAG: hypothetical protein IIZ92_31530 [Aquincola sp.]|nr:hypothetical protein [Aquincola sp.]
MSRGRPPVIRHKRQGNAMFRNPVWGMAPKPLLELELAERSSTAAVLDGKGTVAELEVLQGSALSAVLALRLCVDGTVPHQVEPAALKESLGLAEDRARAVLSMVRRYMDTGKVGCSGEERAQIALLTDEIQNLRKVLPRRAWMEATSRMVAGVQVVIPGAAL